MDDDDDMHIRPLVLRCIVTFVSLLSTLPQSECQSAAPNKHPDYYSECKDKVYHCGTLTNIGYPFWEDTPYCGGGEQFRLQCFDNGNTIIKIGAQEFRVTEINNINYTIKMVRTELDICSPQFYNNNSVLSDQELFRYPNLQIVRNVSIFYDCPSHAVGNNFPCGVDDGSNNQKNNVTYFWRMLDSKLFMDYPSLQHCSNHIQLPVKFGTDDLWKAVADEFEMHYVVSQDCITCYDQKEGGVCGTNHTADPKHHDQFLCYHPSKVNWERKIIVGVVSAVSGGLVVIGLGFLIWRRWKRNTYAKSYIQSESFSTEPSLKDTEKGSRYFGVHLFTYDELEEATNNFDSSRELGEGGFGTVYFGKLHDGRCVAVKRLYENNYRRIEQFMNEVEILTRLVHPNLVTLYGCTSRHSRELLLVYEYVPNGTVADHLHGKKAKPGKLPWHIRMNIAVETASALKYLHISEIIHRDVKTNNILLDNHFRVKVADFGLSRLFPNAVTHISTAPQGTPGYVDPEYHECYQLTSKSDVYSFGVVLIELISSLPAVDITRHRHEINLANMAINKIHNQALHELVDPSLGFESDPKVRKMINAMAELAFQCLQSSKDLRPSMDEVVDTLKDIQSDGKYKSQPEVLDISASAGDDVVLLKDDPPPPSPDSNAVSKSTTPNASG